VTGGIRGRRRKSMEEVKVIQKEDISWEPHPQLANLKVALLVSHRHEKMNLTCMLVHLQPGTQVEKHTHECDDIIYVLKGKVVMWIQGVGDVPMVQGTFIRIPKGVKHQPHTIEEELIAYDVFYPYLA
jgi:quercetin dioxygenase-like cupin family protein